MHCFHSSAGQQEWRSNTGEKNPLSKDEIIFTEDSQNLSFFSYFPTDTVYDEIIKYCYENLQFLAYTAYIFLR